MLQADSAEQRQRVHVVFRHLVLAKVITGAVLDVIGYRNGTQPRSHDDKPTRSASDTLQQRTLAMLEAMLGRGPAVAEH